MTTYTLHHFRLRRQVDEIRHDGCVPRVWLQCGAKENSPNRRTNLAEVTSEGLAVTSGSEGTKVRAAIESSGARPTSHRAIPLPATAPTAAAINKERSVRTKVRVDAK